MSSIQSFLRQRNQATSLLQAPTNACYYVFVAGPGNYIGNYPPGYMQLAAALPAPAAGSLIRDMGKTIKAPIGVAGVVAATATSGFFREVQLITPVAAVSATGNTTFGVGINSAGAAVQPGAGNAGDDGYGTYYIPIIIDGALATSDGSTLAVLPSTYLPLGGQM